MLRAIICPSPSIPQENSTFGTPIARHFNIARPPKGPAALSNSGERKIIGALLTNKYAEVELR